MDTKPSRISWQHLFDPATGDINWLLISDSIRKGLYKKVAIELLELQRYLEANYEPNLAGSLMAVRHLCLTCSRHRETVERHQSAILEINQREDDLQQHILSILALMSQATTLLHTEPSFSMVGDLYEQTTRTESEHANGGASFWRHMFARLGLSTPPDEITPPPRPPALPDTVILEEPPAPFKDVADEQPPETEPDPERHEFGRLEHAREGLTSRPADTLKPKTVADETLHLAVYCLGPFQVYQAEEPIVDWSSGKGKSVFKYLVNHRPQPINKEVLMDLFWPDAMPDAARNNLNVAIYGLRQALGKTDEGRSYILFQDDCYLLNPDVHIWLDVEAFDKHLALAHQYLQGEDDARARQELHTAETLYQGEFLAEDRYEEWVIPRRQSLQEAYLAILDQLSGAYFEAGDYSQCIHLCQKKLVVEGCCEEIHRRLMRAYCRQNQHYLALRQYHQCVAVLREELDLAPAPLTTELYESIRQREAV